jgi:hypothetical protein
MLMKLTVGDDLPLKLGERVPRVDELTLTLPGPDYGGVRWVVDAGTMISDLKHDAAPKPGGIPTKAAVKSEIEDAAMQRYKESLERSRARIDKDYEQHRAYPAGHLEKTAPEIDLKRRAAERVLNAQVRAMMENMRMMTHSRMLSACPGCGVDEGSKHFLSCWQLRPELLGDRP